MNLHYKIKNKNPSRSKSNKINIVHAYMKYV